jgi:predicted aspartyl protease
MPSYDASRYDPPAPVATVSLRNANAGGIVSDVILLIDTGADVTLLPRAAVERLGISPISGIEYELAGFNGVASKTTAVELDLVFLRKAFRGRYLLIDADHGILGRDVLASVALLLDGPARAWSEHQ